MARRKRATPPEERPSASEKQEGDQQKTRHADPTALPHRPGTRPSWVDVVGHAPEGVRIDPDVTEGHPGYEESGDSEIIPTERLTGQKSRNKRKGDG